MKMRMPSIPLITVDPYFSVWSRTDLCKDYPVHWTGSRNAVRGTVTVDGESLMFWGKSKEPKLPQVSVDADAMSTTVVFENEKIRLTAFFLSPMLVDDLYLASRPVSYIKFKYDNLDGTDHDVSVKLSFSEEFVLNKAGEGRAWSKNEKIDGLTCIRMGNGKQDILWRNGDNIRIDWGYFYLAALGEAETGNEVYDDIYSVYAEKKLDKEALFIVAYDDIKSIMYFNEPLEAYWKKDGKCILCAIKEAAGEFDALKKRAKDFSDKLYDEAVAKGGEKYAELLLLSYRQIMAAHKLVVDKEGKNLYISKECFSNGCAATVDVTYPSAPMFLKYNTELLKGMLRPVFRFAGSDKWQFDFAPHDVGKYPLLNGQVYCAGKLEGQMPVEESGNIIILIAAICEADGNTEFAEEYLDYLDKWNRYLVEFGEDPSNQLCTDDFAGHLAHNCNLSIKAIMGITGYAKILTRLGRKDEAAKFTEIAKKYADSFISRAANSDGSFRLAYDRPETFSLKYNAVWDKLWNTNLFPENFYKGEVERYKKELLPYGVPLDSREKYTKSDWTLWAACLSDSRADFELLVDRMWNAFNTMRTRVPMTDWYYADTSEMRGFQHRTVQGGLFLKLMFD